MGSYTHYPGSPLESEALFTILLCCSCPIGSRQACKTMEESNCWSLSNVLVQVQCVIFKESSSGPPTVNLSCVGLSEDVSGAVSVTVSWTLSGRDSADFYLINITTNAPHAPHGGLLNITAGSVTQHKLTGFMTGYDYNITVRGVTANCGGLVGRESDPLTITPQGSIKILK